MSQRIHPTAIVARGADLGVGVAIGPFAIIGEHVRIGARTVVGAHTVIDGRTTLGEDNAVFHHASLGAAPQDLKFHGEASRLEIGARNQIREYATLHLGTEKGGMITRVGDDNMLMNYTHVAHDCTVGDRNVLANGTQLGGHVTIGDWVVVGALSGIHQFVRLGESAMIGAGSMVSQDVAPFCTASGDRAELRGLNLVGLKRRGFSEEVTTAIKRAYRLLFQSGLKLADAIAEVRESEAMPEEVERLLQFAATSERGLCR